MNCQVPGTGTPQERILQLNQDCECIALNPADITTAFLQRAAVPGMDNQLAARPHLFANTVVFLAPDDITSMLNQIVTIEQVAALPGYQHAVATRTNTPPRQETTRGITMGYDFHMTPDGPRLIEINTNAGGAFIAAYLSRQVETPPACADDPLAFALRTLQATPPERLVSMFEAEWLLAGRSGRPQTIAIVDDAPEKQFLYPDMRLAQQLLESAGFDVYITDPSRITDTPNGLYYGERLVDMVYNRLTDFTLSKREHAPLRAAWQDDRVVLTPSPSHHALLADKRNLILLGNNKNLARWGASAQQQATLAEVLPIESVTPERAPELWQRRRHLFFKPSDGFGSRAAYRGDKLTRRVWQDIVTTNGYVAQAFAPPGQRLVVPAPGAPPRLMKYDVRVYTHGAAPLLIVARIYEGQTTNFRTQGGGFAAVRLQPAPSPG